MIYARTPHFLWPYEVRYAAHQLNLQPRISRPEASPTSLWTGSPGVGSAFRVWGCLALVCDTSADKLSARAIPCVFLAFPVESPDYAFYHPPLHQFLDSRDVRFDESLFYYARYPCRGLPVPPPPLFLAPSPPPAPPCSCPSWVSHVTPTLGRASGSVSLPAVLLTVPSAAFGISATGVVELEVLVLGGAGAGGAGAGGANSGGAGAGGAGGEVLVLGVLEQEAAHRDEREEQERLEQERQELRQLDLQEQQQQRSPQPPLLQQLFPPVSGLRALGLPSAPPVPSQSPTAYGPTFPPPDSALAIFSPPQSQSPPPVLLHDWTTRCPPRARPASLFDDLCTVLFRSSPRRAPPVSILLPPPASSLTVSSHPITDYYRAACPIVS
ncbi:unnamed protein product [Closterium sp. NIES-53]